MVTVNYQQKIGEITDWIKKTVHDAGFSTAIIAVSGGIDSAVALSLTVKALGKEHVYAVLLPCGKFSNSSTEHGKLVCKAVGLSKDHILQRDIQKVVNKIEKQEKITDERKDSGQARMTDSSTSLHFAQNDTEERLLRYARNDGFKTSQNDSNKVQDDKIRKGNIMARVRMIFLYDIAKEKNALVIGTENKSEYYLGYFTRFGDEASDIEPIRSFYKTQIWELGKVLQVPDEIISKAPSAGLWDGQTDEKEFGFSYLEADKILYHTYEEGLPLEAIVGLGFEKSLVEKVLKRAQAHEFKHHLPHVFS